MSAPSTAERVRALRRGRPRSRFLRGSVALLGALVAYAWTCGDIQVLELFSARRRANLERFLFEDALPYPLRGAGFSFSGLWAWARELLAARGLAALASTFWISALAIVLAGAAAGLLAPLGARTLCARDPYLLSAEGRSARGAGWRAGSALVRLAFVLLRAVPEYVLAFLLLAMLGPSAWPLVLALALHNAGILGRLDCETLENLDAAPMRGLALLGAPRGAIAWGALRPLALPRLLLYFFYRYETCVREATVLGMLGVASLGYWIHDARARQRYDELLFYVALGAGLVLLGDLASFLARRSVRGAA
jgi:phosphonate transport system permease protein